MKRLSKDKFRMSGAEPHNSAIFWIVHIKKYIDATVWYHPVRKRNCQWEFRLELPVTINVWSKSSFRHYFCVSNFVLKTDTGLYRFEKLSKSNVIHIHFYLSFDLLDFYATPSSHAPIHS